MLHWLINTRILVPSSKQRVLRHFSHSAFSELMPSPESNAIYELMDKFKTPEAYFETYVQQILSKLKYLQNGIILIRPRYIFFGL
jgi:hypothetical protein